MPATTLQALSAKARRRKRILVRLRLGIFLLILGIMTWALIRLIYIKKYPVDVKHEPEWARKIENQRMLNEDRKKMKLPRPK